MNRLALLSFHGCPVATLGEKDAGGMSVYVLQSALGFGRRGYSVDVYTRCHDSRHQKIVELGKGARAIHLNAGPYEVNKETLYEFIPEFLENLCNFQFEKGISYDLIHSHYWLSGYIGTILSKKWNVPHVTTFHTLAKTKLMARAGEKESELRISTEKNIMDHVDSIIVSTRQEKDDLVRLYKIPHHKVQVVPAGVDTDLFQPQSKMRSRLAIGIKEKNIALYVGRIEPLKGLNILLNALTHLEDPSDTRLLVVGGKLEEDKELQRLKSLARRLGVSNMVTFTGSVEQSELPNYYNAADVFVLPSHYESFGLVALEAMACGTPVVASRVGGLKSIIKNGKTGYLIPWQCPEPFAQCIDMLLINPQLRETIGRAAISWTRKMSWNNLVGRMLDFYSSLTGDRSNANEEYKI